MLEFNFIVLFCSSIIPLLVGFVWYNPRVFGKLWLAETGIDEEKYTQSNMIKVIIITFILSFLYSVAMQFMVIHQFHMKSILMNEVGFDIHEGTAYNDFKFMMEKYGRNFRTFKHGAFHGLLNSIFIVLPIIGINSIFEIRSWKYILIHLGYWAVCMMLMGGIICQFT